MTAGLIAADTGAWWLATGAILRAVPGVREQAAVYGWQIEKGAVERAGWPFTATVRLKQVSATRPLGGATLKWASPRLAITLSPWDPQTVLVNPAGVQSLVVGNGAAIPVQMGAAAIRIPVQGGMTRFELRDLAWTIPGGPAVRIAHLTGEAEPLATGITADGVTLAPPLPAPFDGPLALSGGMHVSAGFPDAATPQASALAWREAGGHIDVPAMTLQWGPLHISGSGSGGLDAQLQPEGRARLEVTGAAEVLDAAGRAGMLAPGPEAAARAVLALLALAAQGRPVPIPITLSDRTLTVAQFPLAQVPMLAWNKP